MAICLACLLAGDPLICIIYIYIYTCTKILTCKFMYVKIRHFTKRDNYV